MNFLTALLLTAAAHALPALNDPHVEKLPTQKISVGGHAVTAEIADNDDRRERGLMHRTKMGADEGMLFIFDFSQPMAFWMKNTLIPLSIGYFDADGKLLETYEMVPAPLGQERPVTYPSHKPALYALEMNKGWFKKHAIKAGAELKLPPRPTSRDNRPSPRD